MHHQKLPKGQYLHSVQEYCTRQCNLVALMLQDGREVVPQRNNSLTSALPVLNTQWDTSHCFRTTSNRAISDSCGVSMLWWKQSDENEPDAPGPSTHLDRS